MRRVTGPAEHVVIVGAGLGGLACALRLAGAGRRVTVIEKSESPGGKAGRLSLGGYEFDTGPTVLTAPELIAETLGAVGEKLEDWLDLIPLGPAYRGHFPDGSTLDVHTDTAAMAAEVSRVCGPREADGYLRFAEYAQRMYELELRHFIDRNLDGPRDLVSLSLLKLIGMGGFRKLGPVVGDFLKDPRTRRLFSFQSLYAGLAPADALAIYSVISYLDCVSGVYFPRGGIHALPRALAGAAEKHGVEFVYGQTVSKVELAGDRARAVITSDGTRIPADVVVLNPDLASSYQLLGRRATRQLRYSPSCVVLHVGSRASYSGIAHHNLHFGKAWDETFDQIIKRGEVMSDPSLLVSNPSRTDPTLAPTGRQAYYVLAPVPNLRVGPAWDGLAGRRYAAELVATLEARGYLDFGAEIEVSHVVTPSDWAREGCEAGTPFSLAHTFGQTGPFRPANLASGLANVVFVGAGTQPGVGVPMVLISGRLAAERITGS
ncbi:phytoene dehydrogenase [Longispora fulva]|uniref:Phytoene desaturase n=1 Tax=Longispora fulva TaxID=619741 RepID=A0A8J7GTZ7_9ACTN|nr:phytoene desaturase family protein [Longispora fulva]MBG6139460.1 phytoene desaturase [Longispora fulva]GIG58156.1 phytoene dehydrogenase [Longispora fulva]